MTGCTTASPAWSARRWRMREYAEIIPDLLHVHPGAIRAALRAIPRLYCVTDSTAATGMPDGEYTLGRQTVTNAWAACAWPTARWPAAR